MEESANFPLFGVIKAYFRCFVETNLHFLPPFEGSILMLLDLFALSFIVLAYGSLLWVKLESDVIVCSGFLPEKY